MQFTSLILVQLGLTAFVSADCCRTTAHHIRRYSYGIFGYGPYGYDVNRCGDDSQGTPCCGYGKCNIFCCNCDGGCRVSGKTSKAKRDDNTSAATTPDSLFQGVDHNNNAEITLAEYLAWVSESHGQAVANNATLLDMWIEKFNTHDVNKDGKVSEAEIEHPSA